MANLLGALSAGLLVVVFCLILLWHNPLVFWNDDYELSVLPVFADMARSWSEGHWPILSPYSWVCGNLAGEFQYGTFSVFVNAARRFDLEISTGLSTTGGCAFDRASFCTRDWRIFARTRSRVFSRLIHLCRADCLVKRLDHLLGGDRLVRCARRIHLAAMGVVGRGTRSGFAANEMAIPLAGAVRLSARYGRISLHGSNAAAPHCVVVDQVNVSKRRQHFSRLLPMLVGVALGFGLSAPAWLALLDLVQGSARELQSAAAHWQWRVPPAALPGLILPSWTVNWTDFSIAQLAHIRQPNWLAAWSLPPRLLPD